MKRVGKPLVWLHGEIRTPPLSQTARIEAGVLLRRLQEGVPVGMPHARPMPVIGPRCLELRLVDADATWRIMLRSDPDAVIILEVFRKKTRATPSGVIESCRRRLKEYDHA